MTRSKPSPKTAPALAAPLSPRYTPRDLPSGERRLFAQVGELRPNPRNERVHPPRQLDELRAGFRRFGQQKPVVVDESGRILAGHGFVEALRLENVGEVWVVVSSLDELRGKAYAIFDNRAPELGGWDDALLADAQADLAQLDPELVRSCGFDERELADLVAELDHASATGSSSVRVPTRDVAAKAPGQHRSMTQERPPMMAEGQALARAGDVWTFGPHRFACGDCRDRATVRQLTEPHGFGLVVTDPPYCSGGYQEAGKAAGTFGTIAADNLSTRGYQALLREAFSVANPQAVYCFTDWRMWIPLYDVCETSGLAVRALIVWDKGSPGMGSLWRPQHEIVCYAARSGYKRQAGVAARGNVLRFKRARNLHHYTEKPVELLESIIRGDEPSGRAGATVYDPFAGSGSTIIAAARAGRTGYGLEVEPLNVDTALRRLRDELGHEPLLERWHGPDGDGRCEPKTFEQVAQERGWKAPAAPAPTPAKGTRKSKNTAATSAAGNP